MALSTRNPFRSNANTPNVTGASLASLPPVQTSPGPAQTSTSPPPTFSVVPPEGSRPQTSEIQLSAEDLNVGPPVEEPPPYTVRPSAMTGETTVALGPRRPFVRAPPPPAQITPAQTGGSSFSNRSATSSRVGRPGLFQQITSSLNSMVDSLNNPLQDNVGRRYSTGSSQQPTGWSSYPGQQTTQPQAQYAPPVHPPHNHLGVPPPPRHPAHPTRIVTPPIQASVNASSQFARDFYAAGAADPEVQMRAFTPPPGTPPAPPPRPRFIQGQDNGPPVPKAPRPLSTSAASSDFARDFYAAGAGDPEAQRGSSSSNAPPSAHPPHPPPRLGTQSAGPSRRQVPNDGSPTSFPAIGHPLLKEGKILVYPKRHQCDKCHNVGYKASDPSRPCKKCWSKYGKPFNGPIAYSFSNTNPDSNFQRPLTSLPAPAPPPRPAPMSLGFNSAQQNPARFAAGGYMPTQQGGFMSPPTGVHPMGVGRPPPGAVVYTAGDPRIGGRLCWRCDGKGNTSFFLLDRITCEVCGGIGRTFN